MIFESLFATVPDGSQLRRVALSALNRNRNEAHKNKDHLCATVEFQHEKRWSCSKTGPRDSCLTELDWPAFIDLKILPDKLSAVIDSAMIIHP